MISGRHKGRVEEGHPYFAEMDQNEAEQLCHIISWNGTVFAYCKRSQTGGGEVLRTLNQCRFSNYDYNSLFSLITATKYLWVLVTETRTN